MPLSREELATVDATLAELPDGYDESRISLLPRDPYWAYTYWDVPNSHKEALRQQGGTRLALRLYDVTDINVEVQNPHSLQQFECEEMARDWYVPVPVSDRDYFIEIGYLTESGGWLLLARSLPVRVPPIYPSDWEDDQFVTVDWDTPLEGQSLLELSPPGNRAKVSFNRLFDRDQSLEIQQVAGSLFGSMQQVPAETLSSFAFASGVPGVTTSGIGMSGVGMAAGIGMSGVGMSGVGMSGIGMSGVGMSGIGLLGFGLSEMNMSGVGMSGAGLLGIPGWSLSGVGMMSGIGMAGLSMSGGGMMSGIGMSGLTMSGIGMSGAGMLTMSGAGFASMPPVRPRQFWLVADAELIIYGATEPDATVTIAGQPIPLNPDGTFRIQISFQDGQIDFPIMAVAADGEQNRSIHMTFNRDTLSRNTNTRDEAQEEWPGS
ncbi:MAG: DUF4912 domain-containing protein [Oculatellaceae cyanobacterium Prado106]|nr:DUF4912 domain-containing protein [Oculatellaceae cyanobacterium Prado106]